MFDSKLSGTIGICLGAFAFAGGLDLFRHGRLEQPSSGAACDYGIVPGMAGACVTRVDYIFEKPGTYDVHIATEGARPFFLPEDKTFTVEVPPEATTDKPFMIREYFPSYQPIESFTVKSQG